MDFAAFGQRSTAKYYEKFHRRVELPTVSRRQMDMQRYDYPTPSTVTATKNAVGNDESRPGQSAQ